MTKKLTVNEMIYNTLITKITKEPKYKEVLEALGYELVKDHGWSTYDYWGIRMKEDNRVLVISKSYGNERTLYKTTVHVRTKNIKKVNFENLIKTDRSATRPKMRPDTRIEMYKRAKYDYKTHIAICNGKKDEIASLQEKIKNTEKSLYDWEKRTVDAKVKLDKIIAEIRK